MRSQIMTHSKKYFFLFLFLLFITFLTFSFQTLAATTAKFDVDAGVYAGGYWLLVRAPLKILKAYWLAFIFAWVTFCIYWQRHNIKDNNITLCIVSLLIGIIIFTSIRFFT